jgi:hypothetical protein
MKNFTINQFQFGLKDSANDLLLIMSSIITLSEFIALAIICNNYVKNDKKSSLDGWSNLTLMILNATKSTCRTKET